MYVVCQLHYSYELYVCCLVLALQLQIVYMLFISYIIVTNYMYIVCQLHLQLQIICMLHISYIIVVKYMLIACQLHYSCKLCVHYLLAASQLQIIYTLLIGVKILGTILGMSSKCLTTNCYKQTLCFKHKSKLMVSSIIKRCCYLHQDPQH